MAGIDLAGVVEKSSNPQWKAGDPVIVTGCGLGESYWGGLTQKQRVKGEWLVRTPAGMNSRFAMAIGTAGFTSALAVAWPDGPCVVVEGRIDGTLAFPPRGDRGFGYDPIFIPEGGALTFGEMDPVEKDAISHRARAFAKLKAALID